MVGILVEQRTQLEVQFLEGKSSHGTLWNRIADTLNQTFNINITGKACLNKFNGEKKKWRDVKTNNSTSGKARKTYAHYDDFEVIYGQRACEVPERTVDSLDPRPVQTEAALLRKERVPKSSEVLESFITDTKERWNRIDEREDDKAKKLEEYQSKKMALMEKFLEVLKDK